jgi:hypothetical protein
MLELPATGTGSSLAVATSSHLPKEDVSVILDWFATGFLA